jgi:ankyrin repeat protein
MEKPTKAGPKPYLPPTKTKFIERYNIPEKKVDDSLVLKLFLYVDEGNISKIKQYVQENYLLLNVKNENGESPIHYVIKSTNMINEDKINLVKYLLLRGASAISYDKYNITPLHLAVKAQILEIVELLIKYGADINSLDSNNMNSLHYAVLGKTTPCISERLEEDKSLVQREKKPVSEDTRIVKNLTDNVNELFFKWIIIQRYFKNIYNNIDNYDNLYVSELKVKKDELNKKVEEIINNKDINLDRKQDEIEKELTKISDDLKNSLMGNIKDSLINLSNFFGYDAANNKIVISNDKFSPLLIEKQIFANINKSGIDLHGIIDNFKQKVNDSNTKLLNIRNNLLNVRWLNKTLVINYVWDGNNGVLPITLNKLGQQLDLLYVAKPAGMPANIPIDESILDGEYQLNNNDIDYNLIFVDTHKYGLNQDLEYDFNVDTTFTTMEPPRYVRMTKQQAAEFKKANPRINIEANILGYDNNIINSLTPRLVNDFNGVPAANQTATFPFVFPLQIPAGGYANTDLPLNVKQTFVKELYVMNKLLLEQLNIISRDLEVLQSFVQYYESWNIMVHLIPTIVVCLLNSLMLVRNMKEQIEANKAKFDTIKKLFSAKFTDPVYQNLPHLWVYEAAIDEIDKALKEYNAYEINVNDSFGIVRTFIEKYNILIDQLTDLQGFSQIKSYHNAFDENNDTFINNPNYSKKRFFENNLNDYKINLKDYKDLKSLKTDKDFYRTTFLTNLIQTTNTFDNDATRTADIGVITGNITNYLYPDNSLIVPFQNNEKFMQVAPFNADPNINSAFFTFPNINFNGASPSSRKIIANDLSIKNVVGNHYLLLKYFIIAYFGNLLTNNVTIYPVLRGKIGADNVNTIVDSIKTNLADYKTMYKDKLKLSDAEFGYNQYKLLVEVMSETFDNYLEFLLKKKSQSMAYDLLDSYKLRTGIDTKTKFKAMDLYPIAKSDKEFENLGIKTKLTVEEILDIADDDYDKFVEADLIKEPKKDIIYKNDENCYLVNLDVINFLIQNKIMLNQKDNSGKMPMTYALELKNLKLMNALTLTTGIEYYKNTPESKYFNSIFLDTIEETVQNGTYVKFYEKYTNRIVKKLEGKPEVNTNILSSIEYTVPMYMSLLNSMLFNILLNYNYDWTTTDLTDLLRILNLTDKDKYYGPIIYEIFNNTALTDSSKKVQEKIITERLDKIKAILDKETEKIANLEKDKSTGTTTFDRLRNEQINIVQSDSDKLVLDISNNTIPTLENKAINTNLTPTYKLLDFADGTLKSVSSTYKKIFENIVNDVVTKNYNSELNVKVYKALWKNYSSELKHNEFISNIHLTTLKYLDEHMTSVTQTDVQLFEKLFTVFAKVSRDYKESPLEFNDTNYNLNEVMKLIIHTVTHTVFTYLYLTITKMLIKQLEETYKKEAMKLDAEYQKFIVQKMKDILDDKTTSSSLIQYLFVEMPEKFVKISLKIYDGDNDPDMSLTVNGLFDKLIRIIQKSSNKIINTDETSKFIIDLRGAIVPYYTEYTNIIINELYTLTNNFFNHLEGVRELTNIFNKLNF